MTQPQKLKYELTSDVVNYILKALNRTQIAGVQDAKNLLAVVQLLQQPLNATELEKTQYESLKNKFEAKEKVGLSGKDCKAEIKKEIKN